MATRTASVTGNWDNTATWGGAAVPVSGDTVNINGDIVVTIPTAYSAASALCVVGATANSSGISTLIINGSLTLDASFTLRIGQGSGKDGKLTFGPGGSIVGSNSNSTIYLQNCYLTSTATQANPFTISGAQNIDNTGTTTPRQDIQISNVKFLNTGTIKFLLLDTTGVMTSTLSLTNCVFAGTAAITFGQSSTPNTTAMSLTGVDFRDIAGTNTITWQRTTGGNATYSWTNVTTSNPSTALKIIPTISTGLTFNNCVFDNTILQPTATGGDITANNVLMTINAANSGVVTLRDDGVACTLNRLYFAQVNNNMHPVISTGAATGSGTHTFSSCIMDGTVDGGTFIDRPDMFLPGLTPLGFTMNNCLIFSTGNLLTGVTHPAFTVTTNVRNNTIAGTISSSLSVAGVLFQPEGAFNVGGSFLSLRSNLGLSNGAASDNFVQGASGGVTAQTVGYSDYNSIYNYAVPYSASSHGLTVSSGNSGSPPSVPGGHDTATNPVFFDSRRNLGWWNGIFGSGTATTAAGVAYFLGLNGYRGTPNFDQNGTPAAYTVSQMEDEVAYGYSPTNLALRGAGDPADGSLDVGAVSVCSKTTMMFA